MEKDINERGTQEEEAPPRTGNQDFGEESLFVTDKQQGSTLAAAKSKYIRRIRLQICAVPGLVFHVIHEPSLDT